MNELQMQHWQGLILSTLLGLLAALAILRGLSLVWALLKYHDFAWSWRVKNSWPATA